MNASNLSYSQRQEVLDKLREQLGDSNYTQLVDKFGDEDTLLNAYLSAANTQSGTVASSGSTKRSNTFGDWVWGILGWIFIQNPWLGGGIISGVFGPTAGGIYWALWMIGFVMLLVYAARDNLGEVFVGIILLALLAGAIYLLWIGVPWVISGVGQWWAWLGGHFIK
jgi:hypothetical protein